MKATTEFLLRHGYALLFAWVLLEQIGLPLPSVPLLLAAGALGGANRMNIWAVLPLPVLACLCADTFWYEVGKHRGSSVLNWICRISLEPDSCVRRTEDIYSRHGARWLLVAKFIPGLNAAAAPLAGIFQVRAIRFFLFDILGAIFWAGSFTALGFIFSDQLEDIAAYALRLGISLVTLLVTGLGVYVTWKFIQRQRFLRRLRIARITPDELKHLIDSGENALIVDLRHSLDFEADPRTLPGALHFDPDELENRSNEIPRDRDVILYCT
jgi:membrane protein DedA with SNARE-associated domain